MRFAVRYLIERGIKGGCEIEGEASAGDGIGWVFDNPSLRSAEVKVEPRVLSFDIETHGKAERLLAISMYAPGIDEVLIVDGSGRPMPDRATRCVDEYSALEAFCERIRHFDPDVLTGWNIIDFDLTVLQRIAARVRHPFVLGRDSGRDSHPQSGGLFRQRPGEHSRPVGSRRHRFASRRVHPHGRLLPRRRGTRDSRRRQGRRRGRE